MLVSFLICGMESRSWAALRDELRRQIADQPFECEVLTSIDSGEEPSGLKRQRLLNAARGEYVAFIDDDDKVRPDYVRKIAGGCGTGVDVVTFHMEITHSSPVTIGATSRHRRTVVREVWRLGLWPDDRDAGRMSANHLCAWKKETAKQVAWCPVLGYGEDQLWYGPLHAARLGETYHEIPEVLYEYYFNAATTGNQTPARVESSRRYFGPGLRCFRVNQEILIEHGHQLASEDILCRNPCNGFVWLKATEHKPFHIVRLQ